MPAASPLSSIDPALRPDEALHVAPDLDGLSRSALAALAEHARSAVRTRGRFSLVLAGGSTPERLYRLLAGPEGSALPWADTHVFWGDERFVPETDEASNYRLAHDVLLRHLDLPAEQVHRMPTTELRTPQRAAETYEEMLRLYFRGEVTPPFDVVLLGLGEDGHTASLFPEDEPWADAADRRHWVRPILGPERRPPRQRVTLSLHALQGARAVFFLVAGASKRPILRAILDGDQAARAYPAAYVRPRSSLVWFADEAAAGSGDAGASTSPQDESSASRET